MHETFKWPIGWQTILILVYESNICYVFKCFDRTIRFEKKHVSIKMCNVCVLLVWSRKLIAFHFQRTFIVLTLWQNVVWSFKWCLKSRHFYQLLSDSVYTSRASALSFVGLKRQSAIDWVSINKYLTTSHTMMAFYTTQSHTYGTLCNKTN